MPSAVKSTVVTAEAGVAEDRGPRAAHLAPLRRHRRRPKAVVGGRPDQHSRAGQRDGLVGPASTSGAALGAPGDVRAAHPAPVRADDRARDVAAGRCRHDRCRFLR